MKRPVRDRRPAVKLVAAALSLTAIAAATGYLAGTAVKSPAQVLADAAPPPRTTLTAAITRRRVSMSVTFDAKIERRLLAEIPAPAAVADGDSPIVTRLPVRRGSTVTAGDLVAEISGRPLLILQGRLPAYRALTPGATGPDVRQLQRALAGAGYAVGVDGLYGPQTAAAVAALYRARGYAPSSVGADEVRSAINAVHDAERTLEENQAKKADRLTLQDNRDDLSRAQQELAAAQAKAGPQVPDGEVVFAPSLPATVQTVGTSVGQSPQGDLMTLSAGPLVVRGNPISADAQQIKVGDRAQILLTPDGEALGRVTEVSAAQADSSADTDAQAASDGGSQTFTIRPDRPLKDAAEGAAARVIVTVATSKKPGLTVPVSAISAAADGTDSVTVIRAGQPVIVPVIPEFSGDGLVAITPKTGVLREGERVVVGVQQGN